MAALAHELVVAPLVVVVVIRANEEEEEWLIVEVMPFNRLTSDGGAATNATLGPKFVPETNVCGIVVALIDVV